MKLTGQDYRATTTAMCSYTHWSTFPLFCVYTIQIFEKRISDKSVGGCESCVRAGNGGGGGLFRPSLCVDSLASDKHTNVNSTRYKCGCLCFLADNTWPKLHHWSASKVEKHRVRCRIFGWGFFHGIAPIHWVFFRITAIPLVLVIILKVCSWGSCSTHARTQKRFFLWERKGQGSEPRTQHKSLQGPLVIGQPILLHMHIYQGWVNPFIPQIMTSNAQKIPVTPGCQPKRAALNWNFRHFCFPFKFFCFYSRARI